MRQVVGFWRVVAIALSALGCALSSGVLALYMHGRSLPPTDGAYGMSVLQSLRDPFVFLVWAPLTLWPGVVGCLAAVVTLWHTNLLVTIPCVFVVTVGVVAGTASAYAFLSPFLALGASLLAMQACNVYVRWRSRARSSQESVFRLGLKP